MEFLFVLVEFHKLFHELERDFAIFELWPNVIVFDCFTWMGKPRLKMNYKTYKLMQMFCATVPIDSKSECTSASVFSGTSFDMAFSNACFFTNLLHSVYFN